MLANKIKHLKSSVLANFIFLDASEFMLTLSSEEGFQCTVCAKVCKRKDIMKDHIESYHFGHAGHVCIICGNCYKTKNSLMKHKSTYHKSAKE